MKKFRYFVLASAFSFGHSAALEAQDNVATTPSEQLKECLVEKRKGNYPAETQACLVKCRIRENASEVQVNQCRDAYGAYRKASGKPLTSALASTVKTFEVDSLVATFSPRNGRLNQFRLIGENSELAQRAAEVCTFKLPTSQSYDDPQFQAQFREDIRAIRSQGGSNYAYRLSDISWSEDGRATHYTCTIGHVDVIAIQ